MLFIPACTVILPGHCAVKLPPSMVMLAPPLNVDERDVDEIVNRLGDAVTENDR